MGTKEEGGRSCVCHMSTFEFNDKLIPLATEFWIRLVEDRLAVTLL